MPESLARIAAGDDDVAGIRGFDRLPDEISLHILNLVADVRSLAMCRCVSRRFAALVPQVENLVIKVDAVIPSQSEDDQLFPLHRLLNSLIFTLTSFFLSVLASTFPVSSPKPAAYKAIVPANHPSPSPYTLLRGFGRVRGLQIDLPGGDLRLAEKGAVLQWRAQFGKTLRSCVILAARRMTSTSREEVNERVEEGEGMGLEDGLKERVIWTIGVLIAASARHHMVGDVVRGDRGVGLEELAVVDSDGEGRLVMDKEGIEDWKCQEEEGVEEEAGGGGWEGEVLRKGRTTLPAMRMRMRHQKWLELGGGVAMEGAVLVVARAAAAVEGKEDDAADERWLVRGSFGGLFRCAAEELMKKPSYVLDMNSF